jgi:hypothetical protein
MPLDLTDAELQSATMACRSYAYREAERAKAMENPDMKRPIEATAERFAKLAEKFEGARRPKSGGK